MAATSLLGERLDQLMSKLGLDHRELGSVLGASDRTVLRWLTNETYPQHEARRRLDELHGLVARLDEAFASPADVAAWLRAESRYFGGLRPLDALLRGRIDAVDAALEALDAGVFV